MDDGAVELGQSVRYAADVEMQGAFLYSKGVILDLFKGTGEFDFPLHQNIDGVIGTIVDLRDLQSVQATGKVGGFVLLLDKDRFSKCDDIVII